MLVLLLFVLIFMLRLNPGPGVPYDVLRYHDVLLIPKSVVLEVLRIFKTILICFSISILIKAKQRSQISL